MAIPDKYLTEFPSPEAFVMDLLQKAGTTGVKVNQLKLLLQQRNYPFQGRPLGMLLVKAGTVRVDDTYFKVGVVQKANVSRSKIDITHAAKAAREIVESQPGQTMLKTAFAQAMLSKGFDLTTLEPIERGRLILTAGLANTNIRATPDLENPENEICYTIKGVAFRNARAQGLPMMNGPHGRSKNERPKNPRGRQQKKHKSLQSEDTGKPNAEPNLKKTTPPPPNALEVPFAVTNFTAEGEDSTFSKKGRFKVWIVPIGIVVLVLAVGAMFAPQIARAFGG